MKRTQTAVLPSISLWNTKAVPIQFVNEDDFQKDKLLKILGLDKNPLQASFGIADSEEIISRQELIKFFMENEEARTYFREGLGGEETIPKNGQDFIYYFNPGEKHNPFWSRVEEFIRLCKSGALKDKMPPALKAFTDFIEQVKNEQQLTEKVFSEDVIGELGKGSFLNGEVLVAKDRSYKPEIMDWKGYGYKKYAFSYELEIPRWMKEKWWAFKIGNSRLVKWAYRLINKKREKLAYSDLILKGVPKTIRDTIADFAQSKIFSQTGDKYKLSLKFHFNYREEGLRIWLMDYNCQGKIDDDDVPENLASMAISTVPLDFKGYSKRSVRSIMRKDQKLARSAYVLRQYTAARKVFTEALVKIPQLLSGGVFLETPEADCTYKLYSLEYLLETKFKEEFETINQCRAYIAEKFLTLKYVAAIAESFAERADGWSLPVAWPRILKGDVHLFGFDSLYPVHKISNQLSCRKLVPIKNLIPLNGIPIGLTGQNSGGKTVTQEAFINAIYCAQSGFPVFGTNVQLNVKEVLALVFMERGEGSTLELYMKKVLNVVSAVQKTEKRNIVAVVDELGSATQELAGSEFGKEVLKKLFSSGCSVIVSTQITELADYAVENLNMKSFTVDINHEFTPGVGTGGALDLLRILDTEKLFA